MTLFIKKLGMFLVLILISTIGFTQSKEDSVYTFLKTYDYEYIDLYVHKLSIQPTIEAQTKLIIKPFKKDFEKVRAIYIWVSYFITYDHSYKITDAENTFKQRKGVCAGYAKLFNKMCSIAGLKCEYITGYARGTGNDHSISFNSGMYHAWNIVEINSCKYIVESTWASCTSEYEKYYLADPKQMIQTHFPENSEYQLLKTNVTAEFFINSPAYYRKYKSKPSLEPIYKRLT